VPIVGNAGLLASTLRQTKLAAYSTHVVGGRAPRGRVPDALFWDTNDPYMYVRIDRSRRGASNDTDYVMIGGEDHKTGQAPDTEACFRRIETCARRLVPDLAVSDRWSGQVIETYDGLPLIGPVSDSQFIATGFAGNGYTFGTVAAMMAHDWVRGRRNPWQGLFDAGRTTVRGGAWDYVKENKDYPYYLIRDRFAGAAGRSLRQLAPGEGRILELGGRRVAAYRNVEGALSVKSAVCTHMGCYVEWNQAEGTWDCPCHGSRFGPEGDVLAGPAETPLKDGVKS
jgi:Rieske Fe-S protein